MSEQTAKPIFDEMCDLLLGGIVTDVGVLHEAKQPYLKMLWVEKNGQTHCITLTSPPKIDGEY